MVRNLFLIRHADAQLQAQDERDFQRLLSSHGVKQAQLLGEHLAELEVPIEVFFTSPAARTLQTIEIIRNQVRGQDKVIKVEEYYEATYNTMVASMNRLEDMYTHVAVVGHNPSISQLFDYIVGDDIGGFMTATCTWIELELDSWNQLTRNAGILKDHYYPGEIDSIIVDDPIVRFPLSFHICMFKRIAHASIGTTYHR